MICLMCKTDKDLHMFGFDKTRKNGRYPYCKLCNNKRISQRRKDLNPTIPSQKKCPKCNQTKLSKDFHKNRSQYDGLKPWCRVCDLGHKKKDYNSYKKRDKYLMDNYGITIEEYELLLQKQNGKCAICKKEDKIRLCVDHNHVTNEIRGLLCRNCNLAIGHFFDDVNTIYNSIEYLNMHNRGR